MNRLTPWTIDVIDNEGLAAFDRIATEAVVTGRREVDRLAARDERIRREHAAGRPFAWLARVHGLSRTRVAQIVGSSRA